MLEALPGYRKKHKFIFILQLLSEEMTKMFRTINRKFIGDKIFFPYRNDMKINANFQVWQDVIENEFATDLVIPLSEAM